LDLLFQVQKMNPILGMSDRSAVESTGPQFAHLLGQRCGPAIIQFKLRPTQQNYEGIN